MPFIKLKNPPSGGMVARSSSPPYEIVFYDKPIFVSEEIAKKLLTSPENFELAQKGHWYTREELEKLKMPELRKIGAQFGAKDTDKKELIEELLKAQEAKERGA